MLGQDSIYFYATVSCAVQVIDAHTDKTDTSTYRFIYDTVQLANAAHPSAGVANFKMKLRFVVLWIFIPLVLALGMLFFAGKYCYDKLRALPMEELIEEEDPRPQTNEAPGTGQVLVGVSDQAMNRKMPDEN